MANLCDRSFFSCKDSTLNVRTNNSNNSLPYTTNVGEPKNKSNVIFLYKANNASNKTFRHNVSPGRCEYSEGLDAFIMSGFILQLEHELKEKSERIQTFGASHRQGGKCRNG